MRLTKLLLDIAWILILKEGKGNFHGCPLSGCNMIFWWLTLVLISEWKPVNYPSILACSKLNLH